MFPNFIIVGAPKAGTTSLYHYLKGHPQVFMSNPKEVNFFTADAIVEQGLYYQDFKARSQQEYEALFDAAGDCKAVGEASVSYLFYPDTAGRIKALIPDCKIVIMLRNPVKRAFSHYLMDSRLGFVDRTFDEIVFDHETHKRDKDHLYYQQYVELGMYHDQVKRYLDTFGKENVFIILDKDLYEDTATEVKRLYGFLGVDDDPATDTSKRHNTYTEPRSKLVKAIYQNHRIKSIVKKLAGKKLIGMLKGKMFSVVHRPEMRSKTQQELQRIYNHDIEKLEQLLGRSLDDWKAFHQSNSAN